MGITVGKPGERLAEINVVPLIDVLLVLLIIFMVISPMVSVGLKTQFPQVAIWPPLGVPEPAAIVVQLAGDGSLTMNGKRVSWGGFESNLAEALRNRTDKVAFIRGESGVEFASVARAVDGMRHAGVEQVGLLTPGTEPEPGQ